MPDWQAIIQTRLGSHLPDAARDVVVEELAQHLEDRNAYLREQGWKAEQADALSLRELDDDRLVSELIAALEPV